MSNGVMFRENKVTVAFRELVHGSGGFFLDLPEGAFKESGSGVNTVIGRLPGARRRACREPPLGARHRSGRAAAPGSHRTPDPGRPEAATRQIEALIRDLDPHASAADASGEQLAIDL